MRWLDFIHWMRDRRLLGPGAYLASAAVLAVVAASSFAQVLSGVIVAANLAAPRQVAQPAAAQPAAVPAATAAPASARDEARPREAAAREQPPVDAGRAPPQAPRTIHNPGEDPMAEWVVDDGDTWRTVCVRLCDGYFWPISAATDGAGIVRDRDQCDRSCGTPVRLYIHRVPGGSPEEMIDLSGHPYTRLKTAFRFRSTYDAACKCTAHPWEQQASDRHRLYALERAARTGDRTAAPRLAEVRARVEAEKRREATQKKQANASLVATGVVTATSATAAVPPASARAARAAPMFPFPQHRIAERPENYRPEPGSRMRLGGPGSGGSRGGPPGGSFGHRPSGPPGGFHGGGSDWRRDAFRAGN